MKNPLNCYFIYTNFSYSKKSVSPDPNEIINNRNTVPFYMTHRDSVS